MNSFSTTTPRAFMHPPAKLHSLAEYTDAVETLLTYAQHNTSRGRAAAQVLLSTYNGVVFQLDCTDLCNFDPAGLSAAMVVLRARAEHRTEPHTLVANGDQRFSQLWNTWACLTLTQRAGIHLRRSGEQL